MGAGHGQLLEVATFGGRSRVYWERMLGYSRTSVRKLAVRALAQLKAVRALRRAPPGPEVSWALAICGGLVPERSREGVTALLAQLRRSPRERAGELAWALGSWGRCIVAECLDAGRQAGPETRRRLCQALWYLGPEARGCEAMLEGWLPMAEAEATLLAMEEFGSGVLLDAMVASAERRPQRRGRPAPLPMPEAYPIWLDSAAVQRLTTLTFGHEPLLAIRAVRSFGGFGPARAAALPLLDWLAMNEGPLRETSWEALAACGLPDAMAVLLAVSPRKTRLEGTGDLAGQHPDRLVPQMFRIDPDNLSDELRARLHELRKHRNEAVRLGALRLLFHDAANRRRLGEAWVGPLTRHRRKQVRISAVSLFPASGLKALRDEEPEVQVAAAVALMRGGAAPWADLLLHENAEIRELAGDDLHLDFLGALQSGVYTPAVFDAALRALPYSVYQFLVRKWIEKVPAWERETLARRLTQSENLTALLESTDVHTRRAAARTLGGGHFIEKSELESYLNGEESWTVRVLLERARRRLG